MLLFSFFLIGVNSLYHLKYVVLHSSLPYIPLVLRFFPYQILNSSISISNMSPFLEKITGSLQGFFLFSIVILGYKFPRTNFTSLCIFCWNLTSLLSNCYMETSISSPFELIQFIVLGLSKHSSKNLTLLKHFPCSIHCNLVWFLLWFLHYLKYL